MQNNDGDVKNGKKNRKYSIRLSLLLDISGIDTLINEGIANLDANTYFNECN